MNRIVYNNFRDELIFFNNFFFFKCYYCLSFSFVYVSRSSDDKIHCEERCAHMARRNAAVSLRRVEHVASPQRLRPAGQLPPTQPALSLSPGRERSPRRTRAGERLRGFGDRARRRFFERPRGGETETNAANRTRALSLLGSHFEALRCRLL